MPSWEPTLNHLASDRCCHSAFALLAIVRRRHLVTMKMLQPLKNMSSVKMNNASYQPLNSSYGTLNKGLPK